MGRAAALSPCACAEGLPGSAGQEGTAGWRPGPSTAAARL